MKLVGVRQAQAGLSAVLDRAQTEQILLTRHGQPVALISKLIDARRKSAKPPISHEELKARAEKELARERTSVKRGQRGERPKARATGRGRVRGETR